MTGRGQVSHGRSGKESCGVERRACCGAVRPGEAGRASCVTAGIGVLRQGKAGPARLGGSRSVEV